MTNSYFSEALKPPTRKVSKFSHEVLDGYWLVNKTSGDLTYVLFRFDMDLTDSKMVGLFQWIFKPNWRVYQRYAPEVSGTVPE